MTTMAVPVGDLRIGSRERHYVERVLRTNRLSYGPLTRRFERLLARIHRVQFAAFCNSGTSALQVALQALKEKHGWKDGDEVLVPALTFVATINVVLHNRLVPVLVDVDPRTYCMDPEQIARTKTRRTRCVIPVHIAGLPADMDDIVAEAGAGVPILEDSCEAMFVRYRGRPVGSIGDAAAFSTYMAHYIVTGAGGFATTNDPELAVTIRSLFNHGRDSIYLSIDDDDGLRGKRLREIVGRRFTFVRTGHSFRATEFEAAIGLGQLERWRTILSGRRANANFLKRELADLEDAGLLQLPHEPIDRTHAFMFFPIVILGGRGRQLKKRLVDKLETAGVETRDFLPLINQPCMRSVVAGRRLPVAEWLLDRAFYVGCHQHLSARQLGHAVAVIRRFFRS